MTRNAMREHLDTIFRAELERVNPFTMITSRVNLVDDTLQMDLEDSRLEINLKKYQRIWVVGAGKASG